MMQVERTFHVGLIYSLMTLPEIWATVAEDGQDPMQYVPDFQGTCWLVMRVGGEPVALYAFEKVNGITVEIHAQVLPQYRKQYSMASGRKAIEWIWENAPWCRKIIAWVPELYPNVRDFAVANGFKIEGNSAQSYLKNDTVYDQWLLGLMRGKG